METCETQIQGSGPDGHRHQAHPLSSVNPPSRRSSRRRCDNKTCRQWLPRQAKQLLEENIHPLHAPLPPIFWPFVDGVQEGSELVCKQLEPATGLSFLAVGWRIDKICQITSIHPLHEDMVDFADAQSERELPPPGSRRQHHRVVDGCLAQRFRSTFSPSSSSPPRRSSSAASDWN
jgi:hypothetical protein